MKQMIRFACLLALATPLLAFAAPPAAEQPVRPAITGIAFARFYTTDPAAAQKFYGDTLGFERKQINGKWIYPVNHAQWIEVLSTPPPQPNVRLAAVGFTTRNAEKLEHYLHARNVQLETPLADGQFSVRDPEGNLIIFVQAMSQKTVAIANESLNATSTRIIHAGFIVHDREKENAFWQGILGFRPYWHGGHTDDVTDWVALQVPDGSDWLEYMLNPPPTPTLRQVGVSDHVSLGVAHMQDVIAMLAHNHCDDANCSKSQVGRDGKVQLNLFDPDQTRIEFMEFTPTRQPCCSPFTAAHPSGSDPE
jgi:catechol 2,3-dioxygenase-like lactoylglutathione lyase family enzyme